MSTTIHLIGNYVFVVILNKGIAGTAYATLITNLYSLGYNLYYTWVQVDMAQINKVSFFDKQIYKFKLIKTYLSLGVPNITIIFLDWICFQTSSLIAGTMGVVP